MPELEQLILCGNRFSTIPDGLCNLASLRELYLSRNQIIHVPESLTKLQKLRILDLSSNNLKAVPSAICFLNYLREINLSYNKVASLPPEFVRLTNLNVLYLSHNELTEIPPDLRNMKIGNCYHIDLDDNFLGDLSLLFDDEGGKKKKRKRKHMSRDDIDKQSKTREDKYKRIGISEMMGKRPRMEDTISAQLSFYGSRGTILNNFCLKAIGTSGG